MERVARFVVKRRGFVLAVACMLLVLSAFGYINTRVNYDILSYLPSELESMEGERYLDKDFGLGIYGDGHRGGGYAHGRSCSK